MLDAELQCWYHMYLVACGLEYTAYFVMDLATVTLAQIVVVATACSIAKASEAQMAGTYQLGQWQSLRNQQGCERETEG